MVSGGAIGTVGQDEPIANKRSAERQRMFKAGKIVFNQGASVIDCTVRNVSRTGAMLTVLNAVAVPQEIELRWDGKVQLCIVVWRKTDGLGVRFSA